MCAVGLAAAIAGCTNSIQLFEDNNEGGWFSKPVDMFAKPGWARPTGDTAMSNLARAVRLRPKTWSAPTAAAARRL